MIMMVEPIKFDNTSRLCVCAECGRLTPASDLDVPPVLYKCAKCGRTHLNYSEANDCCAGG